MLHVQKKSMSDLEAFLSEWLENLSLENCGEHDETVKTSLVEWLEQFEVKAVTIQQLSREEIEPAISSLHVEESELWEKLSPLPKQWSLALDENQLERVQKMLDPMMLQVFQETYDVFINHFGTTETTRFLTVQTMIISAFLLTSFAAADETFYAPVVDLYKKGHCMIGISGNKLLFS